MRRNVVAQKPDRIARADDGAAADLKVHVRELPEMPDHGPLGMLAHLDFHRVPLAFGMNEKIYFRLLLRIPVKIEFRLKAVMPPAFENLRHDESLKEGAGIGIAKHLFCS